MTMCINVNNSATNGYLLKSSRQFYNQELMRTLQLELLTPSWGADCLPDNHLTQHLPKAVGETY